MESRPPKEGVCLLGLLSKPMNQVKCQCDDSKSEYFCEVHMRSKITLPDPIARIRDELKNSLGTNLGNTDTPHR
jgi:hypothetical protein